MKKVSAVILASGLGSRFGKNKLLACIGDRLLGTIAANELLNLPKHYLENIILVTPYQQLADSVQKKITVINNPEQYLGQSHSLQLGLNEAKNSDGIIFLNADQPFIKADIIKSLIDAFQKDDKIIVPRVNKIPKSPCIFPRRFFSALNELSGDCGGRIIFRQNSADIIYIDFPDSTAFFDIDTPADMKSATEIINRK